MEGETHLGKAAVTVVLGPAGAYLGNPRGPMERSAHIQEVRLVNGAPEVQRRVTDAFGNMKGHVATDGFGGEGYELLNRRGSPMPLIAKVVTENGLLVEIKELSAVQATLDNPLKLSIGGDSAKE
jgi:hypothetical protein